MTALLDQLRTAPRTVLSKISGDDDETRRPLPVSGMLAAAATLGVGLAVLITLTLVGWIAAPRGALGTGLPGVFRTAAQIWLAAHHAGFAWPGGQLGLLPLGLMVLPAVLLYKAAIWMARDADLRLRLPARLPKNSPKEQAGARRKAQLVLVAQAGVSLAAPYALLAGLIALVARNDVTQPFIGEALLSHFLLAFVAGVLATARTIGPWRSMLRLLPERLRAVTVGTAVAVALLLVAGLVLVLVAIAVNFSQVADLTSGLAPGFVGGLLLVLVQGLYLLNAVIWGLAYIAGPGFAVGTGTLVAPTGVQLGYVPTLPLLGALPDNGPVPGLMMAVIALPFAAGAVAGVVVARIAPSPSYEAAPLWGFVTGITTGLAAGVLAALSGGPIGGARLAVVGPSPWEVALSVGLEVGVAAGISVGLANWWLLYQGARGKGPIARKLSTARKAGAVIAKAASKVGFAESEGRALPGHWMDATEADTQPIPIIRDDWQDEHASAAAEAVPRPEPRRPESPRPPRRDIVDESDDRGGHVIYLDPYAWDRD
ncbi:cell division protein PerM [Nonomuraea sp. bgisy101]|uniref:cell division protein PerM n=1 Tax=Nonomuraea sp. bgisy101 TaxID=3413784 RepID=UPI003D75CAF5